MSNCDTQTKDKQLMPCPFCDGDVWIAVFDDEGNYHGNLGCKYESDPWKGLTYGLLHNAGCDCLLYDGDHSEALVLQRFNSIDELIVAWNKRNVTERESNLQKTQTGSSDDVDIVAKKVSQNVWVVFINDLEVGVVVEDLLCFFSATHYAVSKTETTSSLMDAVAAIIKYHVEAEGD